MDSVCGVDLSRYGDESQFREWAGLVAPKLTVEERLADHERRLCNLELEAG